MNVLLQISNAIPKDGFQFGDSSLSQKATSLYNEAFAPNEIRDYKLRLQGWHCQTGIVIYYCF